MVPTSYVLLLGDFHLAYGDTPVTAVNTARLQSLLAFLVLHRNAPQPRYYLALSWPDSPEAQARVKPRKLFRQLQRRPFPLRVGHPFSAGERGDSICGFCRVVCERRKKYAHPTDFPTDE
jgi:hypothetical protein